MVTKSRRRATARLCALLLAWAAGSAAAQTTQGASAAAPSPDSASSPSLPTSLKPEAPSSLFQVAMGGGDAELFVKGSWEASLLGTLDLQAQNGALGLASAQPLLFTQSPELYMKFLLFKRYFVEARVSDDVTQALYSAGYQGAEGELLQEVRLGNYKISFPQLPFLSFGEGSYRSFGAMARIDSGDFQGNAMVRYDQADRVTKHFVGTSQVTDTVLAANAFITGKYFATNSVPAGNLVVYVQSVNGTLPGSDGATYRKMDPSEYSYSALSGLVTLNTAATTRVAISYDGISAASPVTIGGVSCDLVYYPDYRDANGNLDPERQVLCRYPTTASPGNSSVFVENTASGLKDSSYATRIDSSGFVEVTHGSTSPQDSTYRQPFTTMPWIYTTDFSSTATAKTNAPIFDHEIVVRSYGTPGYITVDKDLVPGSVQVLRNGVPYYAFSVDTENGRLILASPPGLAENITVTYLLESAERRSGTILAGLGGIWTPSDEQSMWTALGLQWSVPGSSYATGGLSNPGTVTLTAGEKKKGGALQHDAALAATYTQEEASGRYRMEGMEADSGYITGFRPTSSTWTGTLEQIVDTSLVSSFPTIVNALHADGSPQLALYVANSQDPTPLPPTGVNQVDISKVETLPPYQNFKTFSFFVNKVSPTSSATLTLSIDDGTLADGSFLSVSIPFNELSTGWNKILVHYGSGDTRVYHQSSESSSAIPFAAATFSMNMNLANDSRIHIVTTGLVASESFWVDEILFEDSVGLAAANFQGDIAYSDSTFRLGGEKAPVMSGLSLKGDANAALSNDSFAAGGGTVGTSFGPLGVSVHARASASQQASPALSGGHELVFPVAQAPFRADDKFDFDPSSGAFGREDSLRLGAPRIAVLDLKQSAAWSPGADDIEGVLSQEWMGNLGLAGSLFNAQLDVTNRARPLAASSGDGSYASAWVNGFSYVLPAFQSDSELRSEKLAVSLKASPDAEIASASMGTSAQPQSLTTAGTGLRQNTDVARLSAPLFFGGLKVAPYYQRAYSDQRNGSADSLAGDANLSLSDLSGMPMLYENVPFAELVDGASSQNFAAQTGGAQSPLPSASYTPEAGVLLSRNFGSSWYDLVAPSALSFAFQRQLVRSDATITDAAVWLATAKFAAVNLFGSQGAYPLGLPFDSDEYYATINGSISKYVGESSDRITLQSQHLATFYAGDANSLSAENRFSIATQPGQDQWAESLRFDLTRRVRRHWLFDLYRMVVPDTGGSASGVAGDAGDTASGGDAGDGGDRFSIVSIYLRDLATRKPSVRTTIELMVSLQDTATDAASPPISWEFDENYIAKLTVPERLTLSAKGGLSQLRDGTTGLALFGFTLGLELTISF